jgi:glucokinase
MRQVGIDIGGTSAKLGLVDEAGRVVRRLQVPTGRDAAPGPLVERLAAAAAELIAGEGASGLGIAAPGFRRPDGEGVVNVSNIPAIDGYPLRTRLEEATGLPAVLDNDANAAALGEYRYGGGRGVSRLLVVTVGTGIGAGMVAEGAVHRICWEGLGDPGHVIVAPDGPPCACGGRGCAEAVAAVPATVRRASEARARAGRAGFDDFGEVAEAARGGDEAARAALRESGRYLGVALTTLTHVLAPERILLGGGGLDAAEELLMEPVRAALFGHVQPFLGERLVLGRAALGNDAGVIGAAALAAG